MGTGQADDRYVTGGVNWESYSLEDLVKMVAEQASAPQLERLADDWRAAGAEVVDAADVLSAALEELMTFWSGAAAEQARTDVALNAQWVADLGETARQIGDPIQEAAGALKAAQDAMPEIPPKPAVPPALAADSAAAGLDSGGPLASAIAGTAAGSESAFTAQQEEARLKAMAVEAMKRFEGAAIGIDQATPQFEDRGTALRPRPVEPSPPRLPHDWLDTTVSYTTDVEMRWSALTAGEPGTSVQGFEDAGSRYTGGAVSGSGGFGGGGFSGGGLGSAPGAGEGSGGATTRPPLPPGVAVGVTEAVPGGLRPGAGGAVAASAGTHGGGMGMGGMPMAGGLGMGQGGAGNEHRRRYPYDADDPFALDQKASPPVIGL
ncbi:WXG100 family type VII secretion target [Actinokineospora iranica]|uniref:PPE family protein n=1 Tax=Actinokineospora iranica TaxID=1271860 RepID=A0A1G6R616_9PSEU|nr:WXG100 family type VII secretion target [Actinokineospora iranica]SDC99515.1 PPE family protein [Actinokineospora iranica]